jgi:endogenous inhibitor of DNA gyrase (YacG/DUF329 family)
MHRAVWEHHNGPIPAGFSVHHNDHDRANNAIDNLELISSGEHATLHGKHRAVHNREELLAHMRDVMQPAAARWHSSEEGVEWHRAHGKRTWEGREAVEYTCAHCGGLFSRLVGTNKRGYCSPKCQSAARRASGVDDETRVCAHCGAEFRVNKYARTKFCGAGCSAASRKRAPDNGVRPDC